MVASVKISRRIEKQEMHKLKPTVTKGRKLDSNGKLKLKFAQYIVFYSSLLQHFTNN